MRFAANAFRLQLHALACNLANFLRTAATPEVIERWPLTSLREQLINTGTRLLRTETALNNGVFNSAINGGVPNGECHIIIGLSVDCLREDRAGWRMLA